MRLYHLALSAAVAAAPLATAHAQFSLGIGGGAGFGTRGGNAKASHANVSLQLKLPIFPGVRADAYAFNVPNDSGRFVLSVSGVISAPIPLVTPYVIAGLGQYGLGGSNVQTGWNAGVGVKASAVVGPSVFVELRRHQRVARDIVTVGVRF